MPHVSEQYSVTAHAMVCLRLCKKLVACTDKWLEALSATACILKCVSLLQDSARIMRNSTHYVSSSTPHLELGLDDAALRVHSKAVDCTPGVSETMQGVLGCLPARTVCPCSSIDQAMSHVVWCWSSLVPGLLMILSVALSKSVPLRISDLTSCDAIVP